MKRILIFVVAIWLGVLCPARAQSNASAAADRQAAEEISQRLTGKIQDLSDTLDAQRRRIEDLQNQIRELREQQVKPDSNRVDRDELRKLAEQLKDIDDKRAADKELILKEISKLASLPASAKPIKRDSDSSNPPAQNYEGYEHTVKSGETLSAIVRAYNKENNLNITVDSVLKHPLNANVKPERLAVGQKIFIPIK